MKWYQNLFSIQGKKRGCHLITDLVLKANPQISEISIGLCHLFIKHTSASLSINENADPDVPIDMEMAASKIAPESFPYIHTSEGRDDMPAHVKSSLFGCDLTVPIHDGRLQLGSWQGVYLMEHRSRPHSRQIIATIYGQ